MTEDLIFAMISTVLVMMIDITTPEKKNTSTGIEMREDHHREIRVVQLLRRLDPIVDQSVSRCVSVSLIHQRKSWNW